MRVPRLQLWLTPLVAAAMLSGCMGWGQNHGSDADPERGDASTITDPMNRTGASAASNASHPHVHDYWSGQTTATLLEESFRLNSNGWVDAFTTNAGGRDPEYIRTFEPQPGRTVYPGTEWVNISLDWAADSTFDQTLRLTVHVPHGHPFHRIDNVQPDTTYSIPVTQAMTDLPHSVVSRWYFTLSLRSPTHEALPAGTIAGDVTITIARGTDPLPVAPPHGDPYADRTVLPLHLEKGPLRDMLGLDTFHLIGGNKPSTTLHNFTEYPRIPFETQHLVLTLNYNSSTPVPLHYEPRLSWGAADRRGFEASDVPASSQRRSQTDGHYSWTLDVEPRMWDSPYANETDWTLVVWWVQHECQAWLCAPHPTAMDGDFRLELQARDSD